MEAKELANLIRNLPKIEQPKCLGHQITQEQFDAIVDGNLEAQIGDYWIINNEKWVIQAKDIYYDYEDNATILADVKHHMTIIPERKPIIPERK